MSGYQSEGSHERVTPSQLFAESINIDAGNRLDFDASIADARDSINISAPNLSIGGEYANSNSETIFGGANATFSPNGFVGAGANFGEASESSGTYHLSYLSAPNLTINSANQNIDGANINGQEINPSGNQSFSTGTESLNFGIGVGPGTVSLSAGFNDLQFSGGGGFGTGQDASASFLNSGFLAFGYDQFSDLDKTLMSLSQLVYLVQPMELEELLDVQQMSLDHPIWNTNLSYGAFAVSGNFQHGELKIFISVAGLWYSTT